MKIIKAQPVQTLEVAPARGQRFIPGALFVVLASVASSAFAEGTDLASTATTAMGGVAAAVAGILVLGIGVKVLFFSNSGVKKGIGAAK